MTSMTRPIDPTDPIAAVTHPDPYPFYADLAANRPLYRDEALRLWVAAGAAAVTAVLESDRGRVRPQSEPVPVALLGSPAGEIFRHLVRMNDGPGHCPFKQAVSATLGGLDPALAAARSREVAGRLAVEPLADFAFRLPVCATASLLGVPDGDLRQTALQVSDLVASFTPGAGPEPLARGKVAAGELLEFFRSLLSASAPTGLLGALRDEARSVGREDHDVIVANAIGFMFQSHDATAGLIGNTLVTLASHPEVLAEVTADRGLLPELLQEVLRFDPSVQNTRRFVAGDGVVAGQEMKEGDAILVILAAANRDPAANPHPERFDLHRQDRKIFTFGAGIHACPGEALAATIARAGIERLLDAGIDLQGFLAARAYRPSGNVRMPFAVQ
jgi:cytochrome P450